MSDLPPNSPPNSALDPPDWRQFSDICHQMVDEMLDQLRSVRERPVWQAIPDELKDAIDEPLPVQPQGARKVCEDFRELVLPYTAGNTHPRFFGWVHGTGTAGGMLAELLSGAVNANLGGRDHAPVYIERAVIEWMRQIFNFPEVASGLLVSGTSMANLIGLTVARNQAVQRVEPDCDVRAAGMMHLRRPLVAYTSAEAHSSVSKAMELLGLGRRYLRKIPVNSEFQSDVETLREAIRSDRAAGLHPFCVIGTAGTVNTGAVDPLLRIAEICADEGLWMHVDGAFGALAILSAEQQHQVMGIELADSLAFDFHKWMHVPYDAGCLLVRDGQAHRAAFRTRPDYLVEDQRGVAGGDPWFCDYGPELSRSFRALKVWFSLKEHGLQRFGRQITENCQQASWLAAQVDTHPRLERLAAANLNIVCFRYRPHGYTEREVDELNHQIVVRLQEDGIAVPSTTRLAGRLAIRVCITNHRTQLEDLAELVSAIVNLGDSLLGRRHGRERQTMIAAALRRPELKFLAESIEFTIDDDLKSPFVVLASDRVTLGPTSFTNPAILACMMRYALEIALLQRVMPDTGTPTNRAALAILACRTAARYVQLLGPAERAFVFAEIPTWLDRAFQFSTSDSASPKEAERFASVLNRLLLLQDASADAMSVDAQLDWAKISVIAEQAAPLSIPTEYLLTVGGDNRIVVDPATGRNQYGCGPRPEEQVISFSSSTATPISLDTYDEVEKLRQQFLMAALCGDAQQSYREQLRFVEDRLLQLLLPNDDPYGVGVCLCASGTDTELIALRLIQATRGNPITNLLVAPAETGSKVVLAAKGQHYSTVTPLGTSVHEGDYLPEFSAESIHVETIERRSAQGQFRLIDEIEFEIAEVVQREIAANRHCIVHLVDASKTGWRAPRKALLVELLDRYPGQVDIVVDACQMRCSPATLRSYLQSGFLVQISGSKFFGGPAFSGALLVPPAMASQLEQLDAIPSGISEYLLRAVPRRGPRKEQTGALFRWSSAIKTMEAVFALPFSNRARLLKQITAAVSSQLADCGQVLEVAASIDQRGLETADEWEQQNTILPFLLCEDATADVQQPMTFESTRQVYAWLAEDLSGRLRGQLAANEIAVATTRCHLGQPVKMAHAAGITTGVLRFCIGARELLAAALDGDGELENLTSEIALVIRKIKLIFKYWSALDQDSEFGPATTNPTHVSTALCDPYSPAFNLLSGETP